MLGASSAKGLGLDDVAVGIAPALAFPVGAVANDDQPEVEHLPGEALHLGSLKPGVLTLSLGARPNQRPPPPLPILLPRMVEEEIDARDDLLGDAHMGRRLLESGENGAIVDTLGESVELFGIFLTEERSLALGNLPAADGAVDARRRTALICRCWHACPLTVGAVERLD